MTADAHSLPGTAKTTPKIREHWWLGLFLCLLLSTPSLLAAEYQWSIPQEPGRRAYLWIPPECTRIRGLVADMNNLTESAIIEHPAVRAVCTEQRLGILWIAEGSWAASPLASQWGDPSGLPADQRVVYDAALALTKQAGPHPTPEQVAAKATVARMRQELARQAGIVLDRMLADLATESGYPEVAQAPLCIIGHSMTGLLAWGMPFWAPERVWGALPLKTGVRGNPPEELPNASMEGVPLLYVNQITPEGPSGTSDPRNSAIAARRHTRQLVGQVFDWGGSHFEMNDEIAQVAAIFIRKAAQRRLPPEIPASGRPTLIPLTPESGWLATSLVEPHLAPTAPEPAYTGDRQRAFWFFDEEMATAAGGHQLAQRKKLPQYVTVVSNGQRLLPFTGSFDSVKIPFPSDLDDGFTFRLTGDFLTSKPRKEPGTPVPTGHAASGLVQVRIAGGGSLRHVDGETFRFAPGPMGFHGKALNCWLVATHPGDATYARVNQPAHLWIPERLKEGAPQTITFPQPPAIAVGAPEITLHATSDVPGQKVAFFVVSGPGRISGNRLALTPIPPRAKFPMKIIVTAYQMGRARPPLVRSATPITTDILVTSP